MPMLLILALVFLLVALGANYLGSNNVGETAMWIAKGLFIVFVILLVVVIALSLLGTPYDGRLNWPFH